MKKLTALLLACILLALTGCSSQASDTVAAESTEQTAAAAATASVCKSREETDIWILLPDEADAHWSQAGQDLQMLFENLRYPVTVCYARSDAREQEAQLQYAVDMGADCLIICAVDSAALVQAEQLAQDAGIPLIAYDRLLMDTEAVDYYVSYDYKAMGTALAQHIVAEKGLDALADGESLSIEFFMGSPEDSNALSIYQGVMAVLKPYLESGKLVCKTGRTAFEDTCIVDWDPEAAQDSFRSYLSECYTEALPDILCTAADSFAAACIAVLEEQKAESLPLITGLGATEAGVQNVQAGKQSVTASADLLQLDERCAALVDAVLTGKEPELNDTENCHNNVLAVPAYLCGFALITAQSAEQTAETAQ